MRIDECDTLAAPDVLHCECFQEIRFPHTRLSDHIHVPATIVRFDAEDNLLVAKICFCEICDL